MEEDGLPESKSLFGRICEFRRERISGLYYTTSVTGYGSRLVCISEFLRQTFREGWSLGEFETKGQIAIEDPHHISTFQNALKFYTSVLEKNPGCSANDIRSIQQLLKYSYLFKESEGSLIILPLMLAEQCDFALKSCKTQQATVDDVGRELENIPRSLDEIFQKQGSHREKGYDIACQIIRLQYDRTLNEAEKDKQIEVLSEQKKIIEETEAQLQNQWEGMRKRQDNLIEDLCNHVVVCDHKGVFDLSLPSSYAQNFLTHLAHKFVGKRIKIHTPLRNKKIPPESIIQHILVFAVRGDEDSRGGHLSYAQIALNEGSMRVRVTNPTFDHNQPYINTVFGQADPLPQQSLRFFETVSTALHLNLTHTYHYRGDQVLNFHNCGRFSMIYFLAAIKGREPLALSNYEIYQGFKELSEKGYDDIHQRKYEWNPLPRVPSKFSRFIAGPVRATCDYPMVLDLSVVLTLASLLKNLW